MITPTDIDDPRFIALAKGFLTAALTSSPPTEIYLVRVNEWFDAKWLNFSGKLFGAVAVWKETPTTIPPLFQPDPR